MKKLDIMKTIQLIIYIILSAICLSRVLLNPEITQKIASDIDIKLLCFLLWAVLAISFVFIFLDFSLQSHIKKDLNSLNSAVTSDPLSRIANRFSVDENIEDYEANGLPVNFACLMFSITNITDINEKYGREEGNRTIQEFSMVLSLASRTLCFVGKNGGNQYLALFDDGNAERITLFLSRLKTKVTEYNSDPANHVIHYAYGKADKSEKPEAQIRDLIALADKRVSETPTEG